jgi:hypothetical protein
MSSKKFWYTAERVPVRRLFMLDWDLPRVVRGPVDLLALRRLASARAGVRVGDLRKDMAAPPFWLGSSIHPSLLASRGGMSRR